MPKVIPVEVKKAVAFDSRTYREIEEAYHISRSTVYYIKKEAGRVFTIPKDVKEKVLKDSRPCSEIAKDYGVSYQAVYRIKNKDKLRANYLKANRKKTIMKAVDMIKQKEVEEPSPSPAPDPIVKRGFFASLKRFFESMV